MTALPMCMFWIPYAYLVATETRRGFQVPIELEVYIVVICHVDVGNGAQVLCEALSHFSIFHSYIFIIYS